MKRRNLFCAVLLLMFVVILKNVTAQNVGINATGAAPNASAILDVSATDKGFLIPRVALTQTTSNAPIGASITTSLLVYNTATVNDVTPGFYYWNSLIWIRFQSTLDIDHDWYEVGTTTAPNNINDNKYTQGKIGIGNINPPNRLTIADTANLKTITAISQSGNIATGPIIGLDLQMDGNITGSTQEQYGYNTEYKGSSNNSFYANYNMFSNSGTGGHNGLINTFAGNGASGIRRGVSNWFYGISNDSYYGLLNYFVRPEGTPGFTNGSYGVKTEFAAGKETKYGVSNSFSASASGNTHYGLFNDYNSDDTSFRAYGMYNDIRGRAQNTYGTYNYFRGSVSSGFTGLYNQIDPLAGSNAASTYYGTYNDIKNTPASAVLTGNYNSIDNTNNGVGNHIAVNNILSSGGSGNHIGLSNALSGTGTGQQYATYNTINNAGNNVHYGTYDSLSGTGSAFHFGKYTVLSGAGTGRQYGNNTIISNTNNATQYAINNLMSGTGTGDHYGVNNNFSAGTGWMYGVVNTISAASANTHYGVFNSLSGTGSGVRYGMFNSISDAGTGQQYAIFNNLTGTAALWKMGMFNNFTGDGDGDEYGVWNVLNGNGNGRKTGFETQLFSNGTGTHYGNYVDMQGTGNNIKYAYFATIDSSAANGKHYGYFANVTKSNSYAAYLLGRVSIGRNSGVDEYILPQIRGNNGDVMITDGSGNVTWQAPVSLNNSYWTRVNDSLYPTIITNNIGIGTSSANSPLTISTGTTDTNAIQMVQNYSGVFNSYGIKNYFPSSSTTSIYAMDNNFTGTGIGLKYGINNTFSSNAKGTQTGFQNTYFSAVTNNNYGLYNSFFSRAANKYGLLNEYGSTDTSTFYGLHNSVSNTGTGNKYGSYTLISNAKRGTHYGAYNFLIGGDSTTQYGVYNQLSIPATADASNLRIGTYNIMQNNSSYAFLTARGTYNRMESTGSSANIAVDNFFVLSTTASSNNTGVRNQILTQNFDNMTNIGIYNQIFDSYGSRKNFVYGTYNNLSGNGDGRWIGTLDSLNNFGNGDQYGTLRKIYRQNVVAASNYGDYTLLISRGAGIHYGNYVEYDNIPTTSPSNGMHFGYFVYDSTSGSGIHYGNNAILGGSGTGVQYGLRTDMINTGTGKHYGTYNNMTVNSTGNHYGIYDTFIGAGNARLYAMQNSFTGSGSGDIWAIRNDIDATGNGVFNGVYNQISAAATGTGNKFGLRSFINPLAGGTQYGVYSSVTKAGSYAGYFIGNVAVEGDLFPTITSTSAATGYRLGIPGFVWRDVYCWRGAFNASDIRFKENIRPLPYGLKEILKLDPITYTWKADSLEKNKKYELGLSSQQVLTILPEVVNVGDDSVHTLMMNYSAVIPVLVKAIQEQQQIIDDLKKQNTELKTSVSQKDTNLKIVEEKVADMQIQLEKITQLLGIGLDAKKEKE